MMGSSYGALILAFQEILIIDELKILLKLENIKKLNFISILRLTYHLHLLYTLLNTFFDFYQVLKIFIYTLASLKSYAPTKMIFLL